MRLQSCVPEPEQPHADDLRPKATLLQVSARGTRKSGELLVFQPHNKGREVRQRKLG